MKKFEYDTFAFETKGVLGGKMDLSVINSILNDRGRDGWELVDASGANMSAGSTRYLLFIFKREIT